MDYLDTLVFRISVGDKARRESSEEKGLRMTSAMLDIDADNCLPPEVEEGNIEYKVFSFGAI